MKTGYNALVVDDIFTNRLFVKKIITGLGFRCFEAPNGKVAINILNETDIKVVLMDIEMPVMNGIETTSFIRREMPQEKSEVVIIALTAHNPDEFFEDFQRAGFDGLITKPYSQNKFKETFKNIDKLKELSINL